MKRSPRTDGIQNSSFVTHRDVGTVRHPLSYTILNYLHKGRLIKLFLLIGHEDASGALPKGVAGSGYTHFNILGIYYHFLNRKI